ncbi:hyalin-like [Anneissia japonica]|uniref:hyalin-like n=1 Tax=Anneissia japonica TaxID=1529436 RepID=UPI00142573B3|nr:hyalin-like [Anneissia japonica]
MATTTWMPPNVTDNSGDTSIPECDYVNGSTFSDYITIVTCNATDNYDNTGNCTFTINIIDETAPNVTCPVDLEVCTDLGTDSVDATWEPANATDNCCSDVNITANYTSGDPLSLGVYTVGYTATDCNGNVGYCQFTVEVKDCEPPNLECPPNQNVTGDENCLANVTWTAPNVTDNSGDSFTPVCDYISGSIFVDVSTVVTCNATDNYDNTGNCTFTITIYDDEDPVINCPADIEVCAETGSMAASVTWEPINATDNCCDNVNITSDYTSGDEFEIGENVVTYIATDCSDNSALCNFTILIAKHLF